MKLKTDLFSVLTLCLHHEESMQNSSGWTWQASTLTSDLNTSHKTFLFLSLSSRSWDSETAEILVHQCNGSLCLVQAGGDEEDALIEGPDHVHADLIILMYTHRLTDQMQTIFHPKKDGALCVSSISLSYTPWNEKNKYTYILQTQSTSVFAVLYNQIQI